MADTYLYVDGTLGTGDNDGGGDGAAGDSTDADNWTDAYQGEAGMQSALDTAPAGAGDTLTIFCRNTFTITTGLDIDANAASAWGWKKVIGCDGLNGPWTLGSYTIFDASGSGGLGNAIFDVALDNVWLENLHATTPAGTGETPLASEIPFHIWKPRRGCPP